MTETPLTPCLYCGNAVSVEAAACPKCRHARPLGETCPFCDERMRDTEGIIIPKGRAHASCIDARFVLPPDLKCPACKARLADVLPPTQLASTPPDCPSCGHPDVCRGRDVSAYSWMHSSSCHDCGIPFYAALPNHAGHTIEWRTIYTGDDGYETRVSVDVHGFCTRGRVKVANASHAGSENGGCIVLFAAVLVGTLSAVARLLLA